MAAVPEKSALRATLIWSAPRWQSGRRKPSRY
jgi:hypothetical protein